MSVFLTPSEIADDLALKQRHATMWASGDYAALASDLIWDLGPRVVEAVDIRPGERVIDIAAGSGNVAIPAALRGASVVATDLTPELLDRGERLATQAGAELEWRVADAEDLPFPDDAFDVAVSSLGIMFAPHHERSAAEIVRVTKPGGRLGILSWTPGGFIGRLFATMKPFNAPLPPGAQPAPLWGDEQHVRELFGDRITNLRAERATIRIDRFGSPTQFREYFSSHYGPTIAVYARQPDAAHREALDTALDELAAAHTDADGVMEWEYLMVTATVDEGR